MFNVVMTIVGGVIAAALWALAYELYKRFIERRPFVRLMQFFSGEPALLVFPGRTDPHRKGLLHDKLVTFEDMLAANYIERILTLAKWDDERIQMRESRDFGKIDVHDQAKNLVLICSPRSNCVTKKYLDMLNTNKKFNWNFKVNNQGELTIVTDIKGTLESASYEQEAQLRLTNTPVGDCTLDDLAMVIRADNPYNPKAKVLIIAGIRGIGTWGAAKYLRQHTKEINKATKGKDFACLLSVTYDHWRIRNVEMTHAVKILG